MTKQEIVSLRVRRAVTKDVGLAGVMLYVPLVILEAGSAPAWTDGVKVYFGPGFFEFPAEQQTGVCIHECLHVVFRHVQRGLAMYRREGSAYRSDLWNVACDAVINNSIAQLPWARLPEHGVRIDGVLAADALKAKPSHLWTSEQVYDELKKRHSDVPLPSFPMANDMHLEGITPNSAIVAGFPRQDTHTDPHQTEMDSRIWRERIARAQAGSHPGGVLRKLASDTPQSHIRWELMLREFLNERCLPITESGWNRPSRRTLSQGHRARYIEPGNERRKGLTRIGVVIDTSGSISNEVLGLFMAEINAIMRATAAETVVIDCDATVQTVRIFRRPLRGYVPRGGGGTDFRPGLLELERQRVTLGVYLTDLCGAFPDRCPCFPLVWAVTQDLPVPFGRKIVISQK